MIIFLDSHLVLFRERKSRESLPSSIINSILFFFFLGFSCLYFQKTKQKNRERETESPLFLSLQKTMLISSSSDKVSTQSNLESFLDCATPVVPSQFLSKSEVKKLNKVWHPWEREKVDYFVLADLWNSFHERSAYGAGVPVVSGDGQSIIQYFVPYLSAIQIFTTANCINSSSGNSLREETDSTRDSFSDSLSDESECEKLSRWDGCSSEEGMFELQDLQNERLGYLYLEYFERSSPYGRVPLMDKISSLAERYPGLMSLRSVDLSPASWMAVAWYPIYHIPTGKTIKDLQTCFLTYHTLSSSFQDMELEDDVEMNKRNKEGESISVTPFGLATYKMQGDVWISDKSGEDRERFVSLLSVADSWLKQLRVQHHDFNYFMGIRHG